MIDQLIHPPITIAVIYVIMAVSFAYEAWAAIRKLRTLHKCGLVKAEAPMYTYNMAIAIGMVLMAVRVMVNVYTCAIIPMTVIRMVSNVMVLMAVHLGGIMLWDIKVKTQYTLFPARKKGAKT